VNKSPTATVHFVFSVLNWPVWGRKWVLLGEQHHEIEIS